MNAPPRQTVVVVAVLGILAMASGSVGLTVTVAAVAALGFGGYALLPRIAEQRTLAAERRDALRDSADRQHRWAIRGDSRGVYGTDGAELMRRISDEPDLDEIAADTGEEPAVAAVAYTADGLDALLADRPACWRYAVFASVLVQRRAALQARLRDQRLSYAPPTGVHIHTGFQLGQYLFGLLEKMLALIHQVEALMLSPSFTSMFGDPRDETTADADGIVHAANRLMDLHERLLTLAENCRGVDAPGEYADVIGDCGRLLDVPLEGYRRFIDEFVVRVGELPEVLRYARGTVAVDPVMLEIDDSDELRDKAFAGIRALSSGAC